MAKQKPELPYIAKFNLRINSDLKATLERKARKAPRSLNAEIIERLEQSLDQKHDLKGYTDGELIDELIKRGWGRERFSIRVDENDESP